MKELIISNIEAVLSRIEKACLAAGRDPKEVSLLLATKTVPAEFITHALEHGQNLIAENKVQELRDKFEGLKDIPHISHFIGHLQSNKVKDILKYRVTCLQSLDSLELAEKLNARLAQENRFLEVMIQVNTSGEESKFGIKPQEAVEFAGQISTFRHLKVTGLMTIGLFSAREDRVRSCFRFLWELRNKINAAEIPGVLLKELSMGMSGDLEVAIQEGATIVRVGTAVFGKRQTLDSYYWNEETGK